MQRAKANNLTSISSGWNIIFLVILLLGTLLILVPMALIIIISLSTQASIANRGYSFFPENLTLQAYKYLSQMGDQLLQSYTVTIFYSVAGTFLSLVLITTFAYVISQRNFRYARHLTWFIFFTMLFSGGLVPSYILQVRYLHINNTVWIFLLSGLANAYYIIILRTFIRTSIPGALFDAARIDGAGYFTVFFRIVLPLLKAGIATVGLFSLISRWNDWFIGVLYVENPKLIPLQTMLYKLQDKIDFLKQNAGVAATPDGLALLRSLPDQNLRMACTVIVILPILFAYPFFQQFFVRGLTVGSIKE